MYSAMAMDTIRPRSRSPPWKRPPQPAQSPGHLHKHDYYVETLPPLSYLEMEKIRRETTEYSQRNPPSVATTIPAPLQIGQLNMYSGPPPPYSYPSSTASSVMSLITGYISPPESRRTSDDDKDLPSAYRQSLPSIHEALGKDQSLLYSSGPASVNPPPPTSIPPSVHTPTTPIPRSHPEAVLVGPPNPYASSQPLSYNQEPPDQRSQPGNRTESQGEDPSSRSSRLATQDSSSHTTNHTASSSPNPTIRPTPHPMQHQTTSSMYPSVAPQSSAVLPQPIYHGQPAYSYPPQSTGVLSYQSQCVQPPAWRTDGLDGDRAEEMRKPVSKRSPGTGHHYGESVKRHLDIFDLETSLNEASGLLLDFEIADGSDRVHRFGITYSQSAHDNSRSGMLPSSLPSLGEIDDMLRRQTRVVEALSRIKDVVITQQHALAEQRTRDEANRVSSDFGDDGSGYSEKADGAGGFAGSDSKKRRGRNAPPGRCHSCNRAETPEWRRGPDGARTLCNACGLHYAKLTRKMGSKASLGSSNLRPKEVGPTSP